MYELLNRYLFQHKSISIPGLGSLVGETVPAVTDFANRQLLPVQYKLRFDKYADKPNDDFFAYLSEKGNLPAVEAIQWYNEFSERLRARIKSGEEANWHGVGIFKKDFGGEITFAPIATRYELYPPVKAERVIHTDARHSILVGDKQKTNYEMTELLSDEVHVEKESWWIYALILAAIGLSILFFHLYSNSMRWGVTGNQQKVAVLSRQLSSKVLNGKRLYVFYPAPSTLRLSPYTFLTWELLPETHAPSASRQPLVNS
jgi:hypothetical protein